MERLREVAKLKKGSVALFEEICLGGGEGGMQGVTLLPQFLPSLILFT
jgi:hypothetical protein